MASYLSCLRHSASVATTPGPVTARFKWLIAKVSQHVTSHSKHRPCFHGIKDIPSGRLPSDLNNDVGSSLDGISAVAIDLWMRSLSALCRMILFHYFHIYIAWKLGKMGFIFSKFSKLGSGANPPPQTPPLRGWGKPTFWTHPVSLGLATPLAGFIILISLTYCFVEQTNGIMLHFHFMLYLMKYCMFSDMQSKIYWESEKEYVRDLTFVKDNYFKVFEGSVPDELSGKSRFTIFHISRDIQLPQWVRFFSNALYLY